MRVRVQLAKYLRGGAPIASSLNMTPGTIQCHLKEMGTSHKAQLDEMRKGFALHYLQNKKIGISEIAYLLSYS